ncbi:hypothetical protein [Actibacterium sp. 188UL27-1]|uniref:hypothetical protein n=1 Tax=Actibacterium sp. 188UL27-1 TaxID=2786961 RepID=UPI00195A8CED|nr:hypothetical protein [Actibacterium sp. 188UL27-1]MBM7069336.1 hypothetical protein [Actibacterium sp. 188UL27-1]
MAARPLSIIKLRSIADDCGARWNASMLESITANLPRRTRAIGARGFTGLPLIAIKNSMS